MGFSKMTNLSYSWARSAAILMAVASVMLGSAQPAQAGSNASPPTVTVLGPTGSKVASSVTVQSVSDLYLAVQSAVDPNAAVQSASLTGGNLSSSQNLQINNIPMALGGAVQVSIGSGPFVLTSNKCTGQALGAPGSGLDSCQVAVQVNPTDNGPATGTLLVTSGTSTFTYPLSATVSGLSPASLTVSPDLACDASRQLAVSCGAFTVTNSGGFPATNLTLAVGGANQSNFTNSNTCVGTLAPSAACKITVTATGLNNNGTFSSTYTVAYGSTDAASAGKTFQAGPMNAVATESGWAAVLDVVAGKGSGMNVLGPGNPVYGAAVSFVVRNDGQIPSGPISTALTSSLNFQISSDSCNATTLAVGAECQISVQPFASQNGALASALQITQSGVTSTLSLGGTASHFTPATLVMALKSGTPNFMNVSGPGSPAMGTDVVYTVTNTGDYPSAALAFNLSNTTNFALDGNGTCVPGSTVLAANQSCTVSVKPQASTDGAFNGSLQIAVNNTPSVALAGTGSGFVPATLTLVASAGNPNSMNVVGPAQPSFGSDVTFTVTNTGDYASTAIAAVLGNTTNFALDTSFGAATCSSGQTILQPGASCTFAVKPTATQAGPFTGSFSIAANNNPSISMAGTASGFAANLAIAVTSGSASAMNVVGPGTPAFGADVTLTVTNNGGQVSQPLAFSLTNGTNFALDGGTCSNGSTTLAPASSCTILVKPAASADGSINGSLKVTANNNPSQSLSGAATLFNPANLSLVASTGSSTTMNVVGTSPAVATSGSDVTFTLTNTGEQPSSAIAFSLTNTTNFVLENTGSCANGSSVLAAGASCTILVKPTAIADGTINGSLKVAANNNPSINLSGTATMLAPAALAISTTPGAASSMNVTGPALPSYGANTTFTVTNNGDYPSAAIGATLSNTTNFQLNGGTCSLGSTILAAGQSCTVLVRPVATASGSLSGNLTINGNNSPAIALSGTASGFNPNLVLSVTTGSATAMNVVGPGSPASGTDIVVTITNNGGSTSAALALSLSNTSNFAFDTGGNCVSGSTTLAAGASCTVAIKPKATADGAFSGTLQVTANNNPSLALSGSGSMFNAATLTIAATSGSASAMNVVGTSPSVDTSGAATTFTITNTGDQTSGVISLAMASGTNFNIGGGSCQSGSTTLTGGGSCTVNVTPHASADGAIGDTLKVSANNNPSIAVSGSATMLNPANLSIAATNGNPLAMNVVGPGSPAYGSDVTFTVTNTGDYTSSAVGLSLSNSANFAFDSGGTCTSGSTTLTKAATCTTLVKPAAAAAGAIAGTLTATANNSAAISLAGNATGFCAGGTVLTFSYTGANQTFTLPAGCSSFSAQLWGAGGAGGLVTSSGYLAGGGGGGGGYTVATVSSGTGTNVFTVIVGAGGNVSASSNTTSFGGGGSGGVNSSPNVFFGGGGGGRSAIALAGNDVLTAGGGGGGGEGVGGGGGGGQTGQTGLGRNNETAGTGGSQTSGGACTDGGSPGTAYTGSSLSSFHGGGGGGGYFGGAGCSGGGGGGSGYIGGASGLTISAGSTSAGTTGSSTTAESAAPGGVPGNTTDPRYQSGIGIGGQGANGGNGLVIITING
jgi:hypothetical protein